MNISGLLGFSTGDALVDALLLLLKTLVLLIAAIFLVWLTAQLLPSRVRAAIGRTLRHVYFDLFSGDWRLGLRVWVAPLSPTTRITNTLVRAIGQQSRPIVLLWRHVMR